VETNVGIFPLGTRLVVRTPEVHTVVCDEDPVPTKDHWLKFPILLTRLAQVIYMGIYQSTSMSIVFERWIQIHQEESYAKSLRFYRSISKSKLRDGNLFTLRKVST
jgi:hypothetical protein